MQGAPLSLYMKTGSVAGAAKIIKMLCSFVNLWLLNVILGKAGFGLLMLGITFYFLLSAIITTGFRSILMYLVAPMDKDNPAGAQLSGALLTLGMIVTIAISALCALNADGIAALFGQEELAFWIFALAVYLPFDLALQMLCYWHRARQDTIISIISLDIVPPVIRVSGLTMTMMMGLGVNGILGSIIAEVLLTFIALYAFRPLKFSLSHPMLGREELLYGLKMSGTQLLQQPTRSLDILLVGVFAGPLATAEYALASRFTTLLLLGQQLVEPLVTPRLRKFYKNKTHSDLRSEYDFTKFVSVIFTLAGLAGFALLGPYLIPLFGDYEDVYFLFMILGAAILVRTGTGMSGTLLNMAGYPGFALISVAFAAVIMMITAPLLISSYGAYGAALSLFASVFVLNLFVNVIIWIKTQFVTVKVGDLVMLGLATLLCLLGGFEILMPVQLTLLFVCLGLVYTWTNRRYLMNIWTVLRWKF